MGDVLTGGRLVFGIGRGYQTREVETFGAPLLDQDANRELFEEQVDIILKAFNEDSFSHDGKYYQIPPDVPYRGYQLKDITLVPRPLNLPVEMWQPVTSGRTIDFIAKRGIKGMTALSGEKIVEQFFDRYREAAVEAGRDLKLGQDLALGFGFYLADSVREAVERVRPFHDERYKWFAPFGLVRYVDEHGRMWGSPGAPARTPTVEDGVQQKAWICGPPEVFIETFRELEEKYPGLEDIVLQWPEGMPWHEFERPVGNLFSRGTSRLRWTELAGRTLSALTCNAWADQRGGQL